MAISDAEKARRQKIYDKIINKLKTSNIEAKDYNTMYGVNKSGFATFKNGEVAKDTDFKTEAKDWFENTSAGQSWENENNMQYSELNAAQKEKLLKKQSKKIWKDQGKKLTEMSIREVLKYQQSYHPSLHAAGKLQIMKSTLNDYYAKAGLSLESTFNEENQNKLMHTLLRKKRKGDSYLSGTRGTGDKEFYKSLTKEWAAFPALWNYEKKSGKKIKIGQSHYEGPINKGAKIVDEMRGIFGEDSPINPPKPEKGFLEKFKSKLYKSAAEKVLTDHTPPKEKEQEVTEVAEAPLTPEQLEAMGEQQSKDKQAATMRLKASQISINYPEESDVDREVAEFQAGQEEVTEETPIRQAMDVIHKDNEELRNIDKLLKQKAEEKESSEDTADVNMEDSLSDNKGSFYDQKVKEAKARNEARNKESLRVQNIRKLSKIGELGIRG
jgi:hypothetical protein